jgi:GPI mannosyltransferase 3
MTAHQPEPRAGDQGADGGADPLARAAVDGGLIARIVRVWRRALRPLLGPLADEVSARDATLHLGLVLLTAWCSATYFHPDEHFQIVEFASVALGITPASSLPWEFGAEIRPWVQPLTYAGLARVLIALGVTSHAALLTAFRLATALFSWSAYVMLAGRAALRIDATAERIRALRIALAFGFLPYLMVRTSSETASGALAALAVVALGLPHGAPVSAHGGRARPLLAGLLAGLAFECRYQIAFLLVGPVLYWGVRALRRADQGARALAGFAWGFVLALLVGAVCDRVGYGHWALPAWGYFRENVLHGVAARFGVEPAAAYLWLLPANVLAPVVVVAMVLLVVSWRAWRTSALPWGTLPFVLVHSALAHKEERFLFPLAMFLPWIIADALVRDGVFALRPRRWHTAVLAWSLIMALVLAVYPFGWRPHHPFFAHLALAPGPVRLVARESEPFADHPFLMERRWELVQLGRDAPPASWDGWMYVTGDVFTVPEPLAGARLELVWSEMPGRTSEGVWSVIGPPMGRVIHAWESSTPAAMPRPTWRTLWRIVPQRESPAEMARRGR